VAADTQVLRPAACLRGFGPDIDPFAIEFFEIRFPAHEAVTRAGAVVHLDNGTCMRCGLCRVHRAQRSPDFLFQPRRGFKRFAKENRGGRQVLSSR